MLQWLFRAEEHGLVFSTESSHLVVVRLTAMTHGISSICSTIRGSWGSRRI